jgi:hypothetical protein
MPSLALHVQREGSDGGRARGGREKGGKSERERKRERGRVEGGLSHFNIMVIVAFLFSPWKGRDPVSISYIRTPKDHQSAVVP